MSIIDDILKENNPVFIKILLPPKTSEEDISRIINDFKPVTKLGDNDYSDSTQHHPGALKYFFRYTDEDSAVLRFIPTPGYPYAADKSQNYLNGLGYKTNMHNTLPTLSKR